MGKYRVSRNNPSKEGPMDLQEQIAKVAYELYERDGRQDGKDQEHWLEAERIVKDRISEQNAGEPKNTQKSETKQTAGKTAAAPKVKAKPRTVASPASKPAAKRPSARKPAR
jgi:hypothetical protein